MKTKAMFFTLAMALVLFFSFDAMALRCGNIIISVGSTMEQVTGNCGEPFKKTSWLEHKSGTRHADKLHTGTDSFEHWYYNFNDGQITIILFRDKIVSCIDFVQIQNFKND